MAHVDAAGGQHLFDHAQAQREAEVEPHGVADDLARKAIAGVGGLGCGWHARHRPVPAFPAKPRPKLTVPSGVIQVRHPSEETGELKFLGSSASDAFNTILAHQVTTTLWLAHADQDERAKFRSAAVAGLAGIAPRDELEGMLGAQLI